MLDHGAEYTPRVVVKSVKVVEGYIVTFFVDSGVVVKFIAY